MTERNNELAELRSFAIDAAAVIEWIIDTAMPPPPEFVEHHLIGMHSAIERLKSTADGEVPPEVQR